MKSKIHPELNERREAWCPPPDLTLPTPRPVSMTLGGAFIRVCGAIIFVFCILVLLWFGVTLFEAFSRNPHELGFFLVGVAILLAVGFLIWKVFLKPSLERKLLKWGKPARAAITEVRWLPSKYGASYSVSFEFLDDTGNPIKGSANWFYSWKPDCGDVQTILYDPENPGRSTLYPAQSYRIRKSKLP